MKGGKTARGETKGGKRSEGKRGGGEEEEKQREVVPPSPYHHEWTSRADASGRRFVLFMLPYLINFINFLLSPPLP